ncbi:MAG TPA: peptidoglycan-binding protein [Kineosporiaceae bacterium]
MPGPRRLTRAAHQPEAPVPEAPEPGAGLARSASAGAVRRPRPPLRSAVLLAVLGGALAAGAVESASASVRPAGPLGAGATVSARSTASPRSTTGEPAGDAAPPVAPGPAVPDGLPAGIEDASPYLQQVSCDPVAKPGTLALAHLLITTYPGTSAGITRACGADGFASEHYEGRALDWMTSVRDPQGAARAQAFLSWLLAPDAADRPFALARRLGVMYVIWDDRIWGAYAASAGWRPYSRCAEHPEPAWDTSCHRDHVHISLSWAGALGRTSFWTRRVAAVDYGPCRPADLNWAPPYGGPNPVRCPGYATVTAAAGSSALVAAITRYSGATVGRGATGPVVAAVQQALGVAADGAFGPLTAAAVAAFRAAHALPAGSGMDAVAWRALLAAASAATAPRPNPPASTPAAASSGDVAPRPTPASPTPAGPPLGYGSTGAAVRALQRALQVTPVSGWFGPVTRAAVIRFQRARGLPATGVVDGATWQALRAWATGSGESSRPSRPLILNPR